MIIPTSEFDPLFAEDGIPFRTKMIEYIKREFTEFLELHAILPQIGEECEQFKPGEKFIGLHPQEESAGKKLTLPQPSPRPLMQPPNHSSDRRLAG
jgi:hypothetical protein